MNAGTELSKYIWLRLIILISMIVIANPLNAFAFKFTAETCQQYALGKNWYCESETVAAEEADEQNEIS